MKHTPFTETGVRFFTRSALNDIFNALDNDNDPPNIILSVGSRSIELPSTAEVWEEVEIFLNKALEEFTDVEN